MYIEYIPNRNSPPAVLIREGWREGKKIRKRTIANISHWPEHQIQALRQLLKGERLVSVREAFSVERSLPHGHVEAILGTIRKLGLEKLISSKQSRERDLITALIVERLLHPCSKLATTRLCHTTTLASELGVEEASEDELYRAMDWLVSRQGRIEKKLALRHLLEGAHVLYDVTSSYYEGRTCPLAQRGHDRDGKKWKLIVVYGVMTDKEGRPIALEVYSGGTGDPTTVPDQVEKLRDRFKLKRIVLIGDRGMLTKTQLETVKRHPGIGWITALRSQGIRKLVEEETLQLSLFDEQNLAEIRSPEYPGERLIACYNPLLSAERKRKREDLLQATEKELGKIVEQVNRRTKKPLEAAEIALKVGRVINRYKVGKHFRVKIETGSFSFSRKEEKIAWESSLDGIYVIRTSESKEELSAEDTVRSYKNLSQVERLYRTFKGMDLQVRPIRHRLPDRVRSHVFLCMLAYYVEWHMRKALAPLLFDDEELEEDRWTRDPVSPAKPSESARRKKSKRKTDDGEPIHSFETLLAELGTRTRNQCRTKSVPDSPPFITLTDPTPLQEKVLRLLGLFPERRIS
jgi:transposase